MIVFTGDWHLHAYRSYSTVTGEGFNSRLIEQISVVMGLVNWVNEHEIDNVIHLGDVFHAQGETINKDVLRAGHILFDKIKAKKIILPGNHDIFKGKTVFRPFKSIADIIVKPTIRNIDGLDIGFIPYRRFREDFVKDLAKIEGADMLCCHQLFSGTEINMRNNSPSNLREMFPINLVSGFKFVVSGHNHKPQHVRNVWHVGPPMQMNHGDEDQSRGFSVFDSGDMIFIPISGPAFHTVDILTKDDYVKFMKEFRQGDYYRIRINDDLDLSIPNHHGVETIRLRMTDKPKRIDMTKKSMEDIILEAVANYPLPDSIDRKEIEKLAIETWRSTE